MKKAAHILVDMVSLLNNPETRRIVLPLIPDSKLIEFQERTECEISASDDWGKPEIHRALDFFGIFEEKFIPEPRPLISEISPNYSLFDHQRAAINNLIPLLSEDRRRAVLHLPTGVGKTRTAMHVVSDCLRQNEPSIVVWLASGKELLEQAIGTFEEAWQYLGNRAVNVGSLWGSRIIDIDNFFDGFLAIGLQKGWSMLETQPDWTIKLSERIRLVIFDEAHQSVAKTYSRIANELTLHPKCSLLGLTATPGRTWTDIDQDGKLSEFYCGNKISLNVSNANPIDYLIKNQFMAKPKFTTMLANPGHRLTQNDKLRIAENLDIPDDIMEALSMSEQYIMAVINSIEELMERGHVRIIVFSASVDHANTIAVILTVKNLECSVVTAITPNRIRDQAIRNFKSANITPNILINYGVLTTGFDAPMATAVVVARPTKSLVLFSQMIGRVLRGPKAGGTEECEIISVIDPSLQGFGSIIESFHNWEDIW